MTYVIPEVTPGHQGYPAAPDKMRRLDLEALALIRVGAGGEAFEELHRQGWRPWSQRGVDRDGRVLEGSDDGDDD